MNSILKINLELNRLGISTIPLIYKSKRPLLSWETFQNRLPTEDELTSFFKNKTMNYGIVCGRISGLVAVDLDSKKAIDWAENNLPTTSFKVRTAKGQHWFYKYPSDLSKIRNAVKIRSGADTLDIDIRGDGGFVVGFGSTHESGITYERI